MRVQNPHWAQPKRGIEQIFYLDLVQRPLWKATTTQKSMHRTFMIPNNLSLCDSCWSSEMISPVQSLKMEEKAYDAFLESTHGSVFQSQPMITELTSAGKLLGNVSAS